MPDNPDPVIPGNQDPAPVVAAPEMKWKDNLGADLANSPTMQKFPDSKEGLVEVAKSYVELQKLLGHEKVPVPKDENDTLAWEHFNKAFNIPPKADHYNLPDVDIPEGMKGLSFDKTKFQEAVHKQHLSPTAAKGLWEAYTTTVKELYAQHVKQTNDNLMQVVNKLRAEWGDAYQSKVELGQMVINKFSGDKETNDFLTAALAQDPRGVKFLAKLGDQFTENKIGDFKYQRHSLTPSEAKAEWDVIRANPNHPYNDPKALPKERDKAIEYVNSLIAVANTLSR